METIEESKQHVTDVAGEVLTEFDRIAAAAHEKLSERPGAATGVLANVNSLTGTAAINQLDYTRHLAREGYQALTREPAVARVVLARKDGFRQTYYISRTTSVTGIPNLASYRSSIGEAASKPPGTEITKRDGTVWTVLERDRLYPDRQQDAWDSIDSIFESQTAGPLTIASLRALLGDVEAAGTIEDRLSAFLAQEHDTAIVTEGVRRSILKKMGLRDQPILDQYQDEIFRLPLQKQLLLLGPPGTGKTTTLIRRLGQKLDAEYLEEDELQKITALGKAGISHRKSWLMFTPTTLLQQYLKDAFAREEVAAPAECVRTWQEHRRDLARDVLGVLKTSAGGGPFVLREKVETLTVDARTRPIGWYEDFATWQREEFFQDLRNAVVALKDAADPSSKALGTRLDTILSRAANRDHGSILEALARELGAVHERAASLRKQIEQTLQGSLNLHLNRDRTLLEQLAKFLDSLQQGGDAAEDETEDGDADDDELAPPATTEGKAIQAYFRAVEAQARAAAGARAPGKATRNGRVLEWLGDRTLPEADRKPIGTNLLLLASVRRFTQPAKKFIFQVSRRYRAFRRLRQEQNLWYRDSGFESREIHPLELDLVLLTMLRAAAELTGRRSVLADIESPAWSPLKPIVQQYRNQILVDEAIDFSPIQLACMAALSPPLLQSFFACGDFHQRLTAWGTRDISEWRWILPHLEVREISVAYRQSRQLNDLARAIIRIMGGEESMAQLPERVNNEGAAPALLEHALEEKTDVDWLASRIREIEQFLGHMPSTAIFVIAEDFVEPWAEKLGAALADDNINVVACPKGKVVGNEHDVRVFDVQHIKGLEFEAVFFVGIDWLADMDPDLFDKYLYVGATRAATYLGITCDGELPQAMEALRSHFVSGWKQAVQVG